MGVKICVATVAAMNTPVVAPAIVAEWPWSRAASGITGSSSDHAPNAANTAMRVGMKPGAFHMLSRSSISARVSPACAT